MKRLLFYLFLFLGMMIVLSVNAFAYLDPSAMTYIIQAVAAVGIAGAAAVAIYWKKIRLFFKKRKKKKNLDRMDAAQNLEEEQADSSDSNDETP